MSFISFVVIAYNEAHEIERCLTAIESQRGLGDHEIIVIDDGSSDATADVVNEFAANCPSVKLIQQANQV